MAIALVLDEELERRSKLLFGNRHMLQIVRGAASRVGAFTSMEVAGVTGVPYTTAHRLIRQLELVGLLEQAGENDGGQQLWFHRVAHQFWAAVDDLCAASPAREPEGVSPVA